ncbi:MAG: type IX secretion system membrane protein PorP/SprF [Flavobacteriales bacterium]
MRKPIVIRFLMWGLLAISQCLCLVSTAQQDAQFTMWQFYKQALNPAFNGMDRNHSLTAAHRDQWDGLDRDPKTYNINYNGIFGPKSNIGGGLNVMTEVLGQQQNTSFSLSPTYHFGMNNGSFFAVGVSLGFYSSKIGGNWIYIDEGDEIVNSLRNTGRSTSAFDAGFGMAYYKPGKFYVGLSSLHLNNPVLADVNIQMVRHYYLTGGVELPLGSGLSLRPNLIAKSDGKSTQFDINTDVLWNNMIWGGVAYRYTDAICPYVGFQTNFSPIVGKLNMVNSGLRMGYSYDVTTSDLSQYSSGSHEVFLNYFLSFSAIPIKAKHSNPRFL